MSKTKLLITLLAIFGIVLMDSFGANAQSIAGGGAHSLFLCSDNTSMAVGSNYQGQLGDGTTPVQVRGLCNVGNSK